MKAGALIDVILTFWVGGQGATLILDEFGRDDEMMT